MPTTDITNTQVLTVLKHLANGRQPDFVAQVTHLPQRLIERVAEDHDWPDMDRVRRGIFDLTQAELATPHAAAASPAAARPAAAAPPAAAQQRPDLSVAQRPAPTPARAATPGGSEVLDMANLITAARSSKRKATQRLGERLAELMDKVAAAVLEESRQAAADRRAAAEREKNAKRIAELEAELARLKGKSAPATRTVSAAGPTSRPPSVPTGEYPCTRCDRVLDTPQGRSAHERRAHDGWFPSATAKPA